MSEDYSQQFKKEPQDYEGGRDDYNGGGPRKRFKRVCYYFSPVSNWDFVRFSFLGR